MIDDGALIEFLNISVKLEGKMMITKCNMDYRLSIYELNEIYNVLTDMKW